MGHAQDVVIPGGARLILHGFLGYSQRPGQIQAATGRQSERPNQLMSIATEIPLRETFGQPRTNLAIAVDVSHVQPQEGMRRRQTRGGVLLAAKALGKVFSREGPWGGPGVQLG